MRIINIAHIYGGVSIIGTAPVQKIGRPKGRVGSSPTPSASMRLITARLSVIRGFWQGATPKTLKPFYAPIAQLVKYLISNQKSVGSNPTRGSICGVSSAGRASGLHPGGRRFEPVTPHHSPQLVHNRQIKKRVERTEPALAMEISCSSSLVGKASGCQPEDRGFKPRLLLHVSVVQLVRMSGCGPEGQRFKSAHSPHIRQTQQIYFLQKRLFWD